MHLEISQKILYFVFDMRLFFQHKTRVLCKKIISWNIKKQTEVNYQRNANCFGSNRLFFWHLYDKRVYPSLIHDCGAFFLQEQYIFVYDVLLEALICGDTTMAAASYPNTLSEMLEYDQSIGKTKLEEQFEVKIHGLRLLFVALKSERLSTFLV